MCLDERAWVNVITSNLEGNAVGWLVSLHNEGALVFMQALWDRFKDPTVPQSAETCIYSLRQANGQWQSTSKIYVAWQLT